MRFEEQRLFGFLKKGLLVWTLGVCNNGHRQKRAMTEADVTVRLYASLTPSWVR